MKKHIICFGDSNTHGFRDTDNARYDETERWTCLLGAMLGDDYLVIEEGLCGRTTSFPDPVHEGLSGLDSIYPCLMSHKPVDLLIIMLGTNDTKERFGVSAACIALGLKRLIAKAIATTDCWQNQTPNILVVTPKSIGKEYKTTEAGPTMGKGCAKKSAELADQYEKIADLMGCSYFDANTVVTENSPIDHIHLTKEGHRQLAEAFSKLIPGLLSNRFH